MQDMQLAGLSVGGAPLCGKLGGLAVYRLGCRTCDQQVTSSTPSHLTAGLVLGWMWAGKPSRYVTSHLGQLSLPSLGGR